MNFNLSKKHCLMLSGIATLFIGANAQANSDSSVTTALQSQVKNIVVIYAENRGFDSIYGMFPGANGLPGLNPNAVGSYIPQVDRATGAPALATLPQTWGGVTASGQYPVVTQAQSANVANMPFSIETGFGVTIPLTEITRDMYHRFFENQMQIDTTGNRDNSKFAAFADAGGLVMGYYDGSQMALWNLAKQYTLADNFYQGAFGGSFLNHQYLICGCAPEYPNADTATAKPTIAVVNKDANGNYLPVLTQASTSPASAMDGAPVYVLSGAIAPKNYFNDGTFRAINTMQPAYQPSGNAPASTDTTLAYADPSKATTLPVQTQTTIGDQLTAKGIEWKWYAGGWNAALANRANIYNNTVPNFQPHHQPFNYFAGFDPVADASARAEHLKDYSDLLNDIDAGTLPPVTFYKPEGDLNQHPGYASLTSGDDNIAAVVAKLQASPMWNNTVIVITYDENGGQWDHAVPPKGDLLGPGTRIPALVISPLSKKGTVDHTQYDTASVLRLIARRYSLDTLPGVAARDAALVANGGVAMGDLTPALNLLPAGPSSLKAVTPTRDTIGLSWSPVAGATSYSVFVGTTPGGESSSAAKTVDSSKTTAAVRGLTRPQTYYLTVKATLANGDVTAASNEVVITLR